MTEPRVPGSPPGSVVELPCGETVDVVADLDMGQRDYACACGDEHAVVMDVHPPSRFVPEDVVGVLRETVEAEDADEMGEFGTPHLMGMVMEEFPEAVVAEDVAENGSVGYALAWVADFDSRRLHEVVVELVVEMMEHAVSHAEDDGATGEFEDQMLEFDVSAFVDAYRARRDFGDEHDTAV
jgi:hypothetical protein